MHKQAFSVHIQEYDRLSHLHDYGQLQAPDVKIMVALLQRLIWICNQVFVEIWNFWGDVTELMLFWVVFW
jgi:hypothetical protein